MTEKTAANVRGTIFFDGTPDGKPVFRVYDEPDPVTGAMTYTDYALRVSDLSVEVTSSYYRLVESGPVEGIPYVDYVGSKR